MTPEILSSVFLLLLVLDPLGNVPFVLSLLRGLTAHCYLQRKDGLYRLGPESLAMGAQLVAARQSEAAERRAPRAPQSSSSACFDAMCQQVLQGRPHRTVRRDHHMEAARQ